MALLIPMALFTGLLVGLARQLVHLAAASQLGNLTSTDENCAIWTL